MTQWNRPDQPPHHPHRRKKSSKGKILGFGCLGLIAVIAVIVVITVVAMGGEESGGPAPDETSATPTERSPEPTAEDTAKSYGDGDYTVGRDIPAGTYESAGAKEDVVEGCLITTEPKGDKLPQTKTADRNERVVITLSAADGTLTVQGCEPLRRR